MPASKNEHNVAAAPSEADDGSSTSDSAERSSLRELIPSLPNILVRCHSTVRGLRNSWAPISGFVCPSPARRATCTSWGGQLVERLDRALAHRLARGEQLTARALGVRLCAHVREHRVRDP